MVIAIKPVDSIFEFYFCAEHCYEGIAYISFFNL